MHSPPTFSLEDAIPELDPGVTVLEQRYRHSSAFHQLALGELARRDGRVYWLDARNNASTKALYDFVDHPHQLDSLRVARAFTAYQYHALVRTLARSISPKTALVISPVPEDLFRDDDVPEPEDHAFLEAAVRILREIATVYEIPVFLSTARDDELGQIVADAADRKLSVEETEMGYRYEGENYQTKLYWGDHWIQTTIPYWLDVLAEYDDPDLIELADEQGAIAATI